MCENMEPLVIGLNKKERYHENIGEQVYFHLLNHAKKYVHIMTPYLILDNEMVTNLTYTAKCGIEVF